ncbi:MAG: hypothetical protein ACK4NY_18590 [Spirosomataceae bacterium]
MKKVILICLLPIYSFAQFEFESHYLKSQADEYFKVGRYWDAFFAYRDVIRMSDNKEQIQQLIKNSSHAMYLTKKFRDYRAFKNYDLAKSHLRELIELNPFDPNRAELPNISIEQASHFQRFALRQQTIQASLEYFDRAIKLYQEAIAEGSTDSSIEVAIKMCEWAKEEIQKSDKNTYSFDGNKNG